MTGMAESCSPKAKGVEVMLRDKDVRELTEKLAESTGTRFCTQCRTKQERLNGKWKISANSLNRRWICSKCYINEQDRKKCTATQNKTTTEDKA